jgi:hypothetical protein
MKMYEYKCTNEKIDIEKEYDNSIVVEEHNDEEEVALLQELCNRIDFYELIASEPAYYLHLLEKRKELIGLLQDYELIFTRETASEGCKNNLRIKFKIMKEDHFTEVGFFSEADDKATYEEFNLQCNRLLKRPIIKGKEEKEEEEEEEQNRDHISSELEDTMINEVMQSDDIFTDYTAKIEPTSKKNVSMGDLEVLEQIRACCPKEYLNDYDKMLLNLKYNKKNLQVPSKKLYEGLLEVYKNTDDDAVKYEIDHFLFTNSGRLYAAKQ